MGLGCGTAACRADRRVKAALLVLGAPAQEHQKALPDLYPDGFLSVQYILGILLWSLRPVAFLLRQQPLAFPHLCPFHLRLIPSLPVTLQHLPAGFFFSPLTMAPSIAQGFLPAWAPKLYPRLYSYVIFHRTLTPSYLPCPSLEMSPQNCRPVSLSSSLNTHKSLLSSKLWLSFSSDTQGPKYFPIVCDFIKTYLSATSNQLIYTNMIIGDNGSMLFCAPKEQIGSPQDLSSDQIMP